MFLIADIIQYNQPDVYTRLMAILDELIEDMYAPPDVDETAEFQYYKRLMEERKAVPL